MNEDDSLKIARYIIEKPVSGESQVVFDEDNEIEKQSFVSRLSRMINLNDDESDYLTFTDDEVKQLKKQVKAQLVSCKMSLEETIKLDDDEGTGLVSLEGLKESFEVMDLTIDPKLEEFIMYFIFKQSESIHKMKYMILIDLLDEVDEDSEPENPV